MNIPKSKGWELLEDLRSECRASSKEIVLKSKLSHMKNNPDSYTPEDQFGIALVAASIFCNQANPACLRVAAVDIVGYVNSPGSADLLKHFIDDENEKNHEVRHAASEALEKMKVVI